MSILQICTNEMCKNTLPNFTKSVNFFAFNDLKKMSSLFGILPLLFILGYQGINGAYTCASDADCVVDCSTDSCLTSIDGSNALSLTVKCPNSTSKSNAKCKYISIICPYNNNGNSLNCNVNCNQYGCYYTKIRYNEYTSLNLECKNNEACQYLSLLPTQSLIDSTQLNNTANVKCISTTSSLSYLYVKYKFCAFM